MKIIRDRLTDKCENDPRLLLQYIDEDDVVDLAAAAMRMTLSSFASASYEVAQDRVNFIMDGAKDDYITDHEAAEEREYLQEQREEAAEMRADELREARYFAEAV